MLRREADLDADDTFLPMVLGLVSVVRRLDALLAQVRPECAGPRSSDSVEDPATLELLLGFVALHRRLGVVFAALGEAPPARPADPPSPAPARLDLLR